ncbi:hypothetical protein B0H14DRAFT_2735913 [Mycena olivaceomarginata]|nr:hypothetical protein B0H14DRAFT_2735913 [Mycena olivaceomarginata]
MVQLTAGSCLGLHNAVPGDTSLFDATHTLQLLSVRSVNSNTTSTVDRYRIIVTRIINVTKMTCNFVQDKRLLIILSLDLVEHTADKIGNPATLGPEQGQAAGTPTALPLAPAPAPVQQQKQVSAPSNRAAAPSHGNRPIYPIEGLSPYQNNWTIKALVTQKSDMKHYATAKGEGKLFNVTLMDETGEIRATAFNAVAETVHEKLQEGKVYYISRARVNIAKKQFSHLNNEYELGFEKNTEIEECHDTANVPSIKYDFIALKDLEQQEKDSTCDVIAIVKAVEDTQEITSKATNRKVTKRELTLVDTSGFSVRMTLWGKQAQDFNSPESVIAFKSVKVGDFGGRSLSFFSSSTMTINPDIEAAHILRGWYDESGKGASFQAHQSSGGGGTGGSGFQRNQIRSIADVKLNLTVSETEAAYFSARATIVFMKPDSLWYPACPKDGCNKKVTEDTNGWHCEKCKDDYAQPKYRYIMSMACSDWSDQAWFQGFNEVGELVFGKSADELNEIKERDEHAFAAIVQEATCETYNFLCRARSDEYNGQTRVRYGISRINPLNYKEEALALRDLLLSPWGQTAA